MAETKIHPTYGEVRILQNNRALVQIETENGDSFWIAASSFIKKKAKPRKKKAVRVVQKVDKSEIDALLVRETRVEEWEPEVFDAVEEIIQEDELEELENEEAEIAEDAA
jgi:hypothetical protein